MGVSEREFWGMLPREFMRRAEASGERVKAAREERLQHTCLVLDGILNYGGMRGKDFKPVKLGHHYELFTGASEKRADMDERWERRLRRHNDRVARKGRARQEAVNG